MNKTIVIGSDHAGYELKMKLVQYLADKKYKINDLGTNSNESTDYPEYAHLVAQAIEEDNNLLGILICGSANGVSITANKHKDVRAAIAWNVEISEMARLHNDANIISLPARYISEEEAKDIVTVFLGTEFEGGRHARRVNKINIE